MRTIAALVVLLAGSGAGAFAVGSQGTSAAPGRLVAYDLANGAVRFDTTAPTASVHLHAIGGRVVVATGADNCDVTQRETAFAISLPDGALRWSRTLRGACVDYAAPGTLGGNTVVVATRHGISGWSLANGSSRWTLRRLSQPAQLAGTAIASTDDAATILRSRDGRSLARRTVPHNGARVYSGDRTAVFVGPFGDLVGIDVPGGRVLWRRASGLSDGFRTVGGTSGAFVLNAQVRDLRSGRLLWSAPSTPVAVGGGLAFVQDANLLRALDIRTGDMRWEIELPPPDPAVEREIVAGSGAVAVVDPGSITLLEAATGATRWRVSLGDTGTRSHQPGAIADGMLLLPSTSSDWVPYDE